MLKKARRGVPAILASSVLMTSASGRGQGTAGPQTLPIEKGGTVEIRNVMGSVQVRGGEGDEVRLVAHLGKGTKGLIFEAKEGGVMIQVELLSENNLGSVEGSELRVDVPRTAALDIKTVSAGVDVRGVDGSVDIKTVSGDVQTETGMSPLRLKTVSGDADLRAVRGSLTLVSVSGDFNVGAESLTGLDVRSVSGDLWLSTGAFEAGSYSVKTQSGDALLRVPEAVPVRVVVKGLKGAGQTLGDSSAEATRIDVATFAGEVTLERS